MRCSHGRDCILLNLQLPVQSMHITIKVVSLNPAHGSGYSIQHYVIKFVNDLWQVGGYLRVLRFLPSIKLSHDITEILLKVELNTINKTNQSDNIYFRCCDFESGLCDHEVFSIQHYVIKFVSDLRSSVVFSDHHNLTEILLKVVLNTIAPNTHYRYTIDHWSLPI